MTQLKFALERSFESGLVALVQAAPISKRLTDKAFACLSARRCAWSLGGVEVEYEVDRWYLVFLTRYREGGHSSNGVYIMPVFDH
jgi:hypothetical protein